MAHSFSQTHSFWWPGSFTYTVNYRISYSLYEIYMAGTVSISYFRITVTLTPRYAQLLSSAKEENANCRTIKLSVTKKRDYEITTCRTSCYINICAWNLMGLCGVSQFRKESCWLCGLICLIIYNSKPGSWNLMPLGVFLCPCVLLCLFCSLLVENTWLGNLSLSRPTSLQKKSYKIKRGVLSCFILWRHRHAGWKWMRIFTCH